MKTAVEWLIEELKKVHHPTEAMIMYAKKLEKEQIMDAAERWKGTKFAEQYYNETYGSKGSNETNGNNVEKVPNVTSSQTEISDEEIENGAKEWYEKKGLLRPYQIEKIAWISAIKWYREQLKQRQ